MSRVLAIAVVLATGCAAVLASDYGSAFLARPAFAPETRGSASAQPAFALSGQNGRQAFPGNVEYDGRLVFVRIRYNSGFGGGFAQARGSRGEPPWAHDYPTADTHLMRILKELTVANPLVDGSNVFTLDDPDLFDYPIAYVSEPGYWTMSDEEANGLRVYLKKGGFIIFDDFRDNHW